eukprot:11165875-Ditylum_brightwellii.AAC.1
MQRQHLDIVQMYYMESVSTEGPFVDGSNNATALENSGEWVQSKGRTFAAKLEAMKNLIEDQGLLVSRLLLEMSDEDIVCVVKNVAKLFINTIEGLSEIVVERHSRNQDSDLVDTKLLPAVPQDLIRLCNAEEQGELLDAAHKNMVLRGAIQSLKAASTLDDSWNVVKDRFKYLQRFYGFLLLCS